MTFNFTPKTDEELALMSVLPDGDYEFSVKKAEDKVSKSGNPMIELYLEIYGADGGSRFVNDWLVSTDKMTWKIKRFCASVGILDQYDSGNIRPSSLINKNGRATISTEKKDDYPPRNRIKDYIKPNGTTPQENPSINPADTSLPTDDDIPF